MEKEEPQEIKENVVEQYTIKKRLLTIYSFPALMLLSIEHKDSWTFDKAIRGDLYLAVLTASIMYSIVIINIIDFLNG